MRYAPAQDELHLRDTKRHDRKFVEERKLFSLPALIFLELELIILLDYTGTTFLRDFRATLGRESIGPRS